MAMSIISRHRHRATSLFFWLWLAIKGRWRDGDVDHSSTPPPRHLPFFLVVACYIE